MILYNNVDNWLPESAQTFLANQFMPLLLFHLITFRVSRQSKACELIGSDELILIAENSLAKIAF